MREVRFLRGVFRGASELPLCLATVRLNGRFEPLAESLIDTGAAITMARSALVREWLIGDEKDLESGVPQIVQGVGGRQMRVFGHLFDLYLRRDRHSEETLVLRRTWVFAGDQAFLPFPILLGQNSALKGRILRHQNCRHNPYWELREA